MTYVVQHPVESLRLVQFVDTMTDSLPPTVEQIVTTLPDSIKVPLTKAMATAQFDSAKAIVTRAPIHPYATAVFTLTINMLAAFPDTLRPRLMHMVFQDHTLGCR